MAETRSGIPDPPLSYKEMREKRASSFDTASVFSYVVDGEVSTAVSSLQNDLMAHMLNPEPRIERVNLLPWENEDE
jgi:hypothetical protein